MQWSSQPTIPKLLALPSGAVEKVSTLLPAPAVTNSSVPLPPPLTIDGARNKSIGVSVVSTGPLVDMSVMSAVRTKGL